VLAFAHLNLRYNPFGALSLEGMGELALVDTDRYRNCLQPERAALQFVGEKGYGKTTRLRALCRELPGAVYVRIPPDRRVEVPTGSPLLVDESQNLGWWRRRRLFAGPSRLVLGTHVDHTRELVRHGRLVTTIAVADETTPDLLHRLIQRRIEAARRGAGPIPVVEFETVQKLLEQHGPDVRTILAILYNRFQSLEGQSLIGQSLIGQSFVGPSLARSTHVEV
jgi:hypothetical protein